MILSIVRAGNLINYILHSDFGVQRNPMRKMLCKVWDEDSKCPSFLFKNSIFLERLYSNVEGKFLASSTLTTSI